MSPRTSGSERRAEVTYLVPDVDAAMAWLTNGLGYGVLRDEKNPIGKRWVEMAPTRLRGPALRLAVPRDAEEARIVGRQAGCLVLFFVHTDDLARDHAALASRGVNFTEAPRQEPYGRVAVFTDPYGNRWDLIEAASETR